MNGARQAEFSIDPQFLDRWSPRSFDGTTVIDANLMRLFEAARWAPSAFNVRPWRFLYAGREAPDWDRFLGVLVPFNQSWARKAGAIIIVLSDTVTMGADGSSKPSHSHSFDAGAAWGYLALAAHRMGLYAHAMTGVDFDAARATLNVPERYRIECAIAVGRIGDPADLPEGLRAREMPSERRAAKDFAFAGGFAAEHA